MAVLTTEQREQIEAELAAFNRLLTELGRPRELLRSIILADADRDLPDAGLRVADARVRMIAKATEISELVHTWPDVETGP